LTQKCLHVDRVQVEGLDFDGCDETEEIVCLTTHGCRIRVEQDLRPCWPSVTLNRPCFEEPTLTESPDDRPVQAKDVLAVTEILLYATKASRLHIK